MSKLKVVLILLALASLFIGQCQCGYEGENPEGGFSDPYSWHYYYNSQLVGNWQTTDAIWAFEKNGDLKIMNARIEKSGSWKADETGLSVTIDGKTTSYNVNVMEENHLQLVTGKTSFILVKK